MPRCCFPVCDCTMPSDTYCGLPDRSRLAALTDDDPRTWIGDEPATPTGDHNALVALLVAYADGDYDQGECDGIAEAILAAGWRAPLTPPCDRYCEPLACPRCGT